MHILVVDDEQVSRIKMKTLLGLFGRCRTAENGQEALRRFEEALSAEDPYRLVTLDIEMPDLSGTEVLLEMRRLERDHGITPARRAKIIMVTSHSDKDQVMACIHSGCDDYIAKPINQQLIVGKLGQMGFRKTPSPSAVARDSAISANTIFKDINRALRSGELQLPLQPQISMTFRQLMNANADMQQIVALIEKDMVIAAKVIRIANSALYRGFDPALNTQQAISRLGLTVTEQTVTALANQRLYVTDQRRFRPLLESLWQHSLAAAHAAQCIEAAGRCRLDLDAFVAGLMHDIGALALIQIIAEMEKRNRYPDPVNTQAMTDTVQTHHATFGGNLLKKWNFAHAYVQATLDHHSNGNRPFGDANSAVVHLANLMAKAVGFHGMDRAVVENLAQSPSARYLQLGKPQLDNIESDIRGRLATAQEMLNTGGVDQ
ncbi:MAG: HDOD domain-containing protein [Desulfatitalea sp.]|nr:HDOD domain-containing protein [Desulfatitalea sp.]NNJ98839.1 HDOD domain-containing protein [Desulfatitalea sp.]